MTKRSAGGWIPAPGFSVALSALMVTLAPSLAQAQSARFDEFDVTSPKADGWPAILDRILGGGSSG